MNLLVNVARYEAEILLAAMAAVIAYKFLSGGIKTDGLLSEKTPEGRGRISAARVQLLLVTLAMAFYQMALIARR